MDHSPVVINFPCVKCRYLDFGSEFSKKVMSRYLILGVIFEGSLLHIRNDFKEHSSSPQGPSQVILLSERLVVVLVSKHQCGQ